VAETVAAFSGERSDSAELKLLKNSANNRTHMLHITAVVRIYLQKFFSLSFSVPALAIKCNLQ